MGVEGGHEEERKGMNKKETKKEKEKKGGGEERSKTENMQNKKSQGKKKEFNQSKNPRVINLFLIPYAVFLPLHVCEKECVRSCGCVSVYVCQCILE